jgi:hypothetical protein
MAVIQATVPQAHLATAMGNPNRLLVDYSTDILLPVPGPYLIARLRRDFLHGLMVVNEFLGFAEDAIPYFNAGGRLNLADNDGQVLMPRSGDTSPYGRMILPAARGALQAQMTLQAAVSVRSLAPDVVYRQDEPMPASEALLTRLSAPNLVFREMFEHGVIQRSPTLFNPLFRNTRTFNARCAIVLRRLLSTRAPLLPQAITPMLVTIAEQAVATAKEKHPSFLDREFATISLQTQRLLIEWLVVYHRDKSPAAPSQFNPDLTPDLGFQPSTFAREWALNRKEQMELLLGAPELRGPLAAEPVPPQGLYRREDYTSSQNELTLITAESRRSRTGEALALGGSLLRRELNGVYYSGAGTLNQLTSQASNALLVEERRHVVLSLVREISESRETSSVDVSTQLTSSTVVREAHGVDPKLSATHHRFKVVVPVTTTVEMYDVGLTWSPRLSNPFFALRQAIRDAYDGAYRSHLRQYYVPEPVSPTLVWERYVVSTDLNMKAENAQVITRKFTIPLSSGNRHDRPDLAGATVVWNQSESFWNDDPDHYTARLENLTFGGGEIAGSVRLETDEDDADFQGFAHIEVPVLRYTQETVDAFVQFELEMRDYNLKRQALEAQAHQYARIKEREFIERHEQREPLHQILFDALMRQVCAPSVAQHISYYKEIISRTFDWTNVKVEFEPAPLDTLAFPDFEADHFVNTLWVRVFLPIVRADEGTFFDALTACGSFQVRASVDVALNQVNAIRARLKNNGPDQIDQFSSEMVIGEHVEAVMSNHELAT